MLSLPCLLPSEEPQKIALSNHDLADSSRSRKIQEHTGWVSPKRTSSWRMLWPANGTLPERARAFISSVPGSCTGLLGRELLGQQQGSRQPCSRKPAGAPPAASSTMTFGHGSWVPRASTQSTSGDADQLNSAAPGSPQPQPARPLQSQQGPAVTCHHLPPDLL